MTIHGAPCKGKNCGATDGLSHSPECIAEHEEHTRQLEKAELVRSTKETIHEHKGPLIDGVQTYLYWWIANGLAYCELHVGHCSRTVWLEGELLNQNVCDTLLRDFAREVSNG